MYSFALLHCVAVIAVLCCLEAKFPLKDIKVAPYAALNLMHSDNGSVFINEAALRWACYLRYRDDEIRPLSAPVSLINRSVGLK